MSFYVRVLFGLNKAHVSGSASLSQFLNIPFALNRYANRRPLRIVYGKPHNHSGALH
jgi:hypothetical protein